ncbi:hypothetical protein BGZ73_003337 [Actinomortierella ambigua]|nr:hypothetical protein BGZ73_003337 [Actinomortierella ambigua]
MAFTNHSTLLKVDVFLVLVATICAIVALAAWQINTLVEIKGYNIKGCLLFPSDDGSPNHSCSFAVGSSAIMIVGAVFLGAMDFVTWKKSENYKGKRACLTAMFLAAFLTVLSLITFGVVGFGDLKLCQKIDGSCSRLDRQGGILTGIGACGVAFLSFAVYTVLERIQYVRRHVNGDKLIFAT